LLNLTFWLEQKLHKSDIECIGEESGYNKEKRTSVVMFSDFAYKC